MVGIINSCSSYRMSVAPFSYADVSAVAYLVDSRHSRCLDILLRNCNRYRGLYLHRQRFVRMDYVHRMDDDNHRQCRSLLVNNPRSVCISLCVCVYVDMWVCLCIRAFALLQEWKQVGIFVYVYNIKKIDL